MIQNFDAIGHEEKHAADFSKSRSIQLEISSQHNYDDGITYFYLQSPTAIRRSLWERRQAPACGDLELGHYYKNPWGNGWYWFSSISGEKNRCPSKAEQRGLGGSPHERLLQDSDRFN